MNFRFQISGFGFILTPFDGQADIEFANPSGWSHPGLPGCVIQAGAQDAVEKFTISDRL